MKPKGLAQTLLGGAVLTVLSSPLVFAQSADWNVDAAGNWSTDTNWNPVVVPGNAAGDVVGLTNNITAARIVTIDTTPRTVGTLNIGDSDNTHAFTLAASGGGTLTFNNNGSGAVLNETGGILDTISAPIILADNLTINAGGVTATEPGLNITGVISETGGARTVTLSGTGGVRLSAANTYTGGTIVNSGEVHVGDNAALGTGAITINGGTFIPRLAARTLANALVVNANFTVGKTGFNNQMNFSGGVDLTGGTRTITVAETTQALDSTFSGVISNGALTKAGAGTLVLTGVNTYAGDTTISAGTLLVDGAGQLGSGTYAGAIANSGTLTLSSTAAQTLSGVISGTGGLNVLDTGVVTLSATNTYSGNTTIGNPGGGSVIRATANNALGTGTVSIFGNAGTNRLELSGGITLGNAIVQSGKDTTATLAAPSIVNISGDNTLTGTVSVQSGGTATSIQSDTGTLTLSNATALTSGATGTRIVGFKGAGNIAVSGAITNGSATTLSIEKLGTGTTTLSGTNTYTGTTTVSGGTLLINGNNSGATGAVTVANANTTLGGAGTVGGATTLGAGTKLAAGASAGAVGTITFANGLNLAAASNDTAAYVFDLGAVVSSDLVNITAGTLDVGSNLSATDFTFNQLGGFGVGTYTLFDSATAITGTVDSSIFSLSGSLNGQLATADSGSNVVLNVTLVPEPSVALLGGLGVLGLLRRRRVN